MTWQRDLVDVIRLVTLSWVSDHRFFGQVQFNYMSANTQIGGNMGRIPSTIPVSEDGRRMPHTKKYKQRRHRYTLSPRSLQREVDTANTLILAHVRLTICSIINHFAWLKLPTFW